MLALVVVAILVEYASISVDDAHPLVTFLYPFELALLYLVFVDHTTEKTPALFLRYVLSVKGRIVFFERGDLQMLQIQVVFCDSELEIEWALALPCLDYFHTDSLWECIIDILKILPFLAPLISLLPSVQEAPVFELHLKPFLEGFIFDLWKLEIVT